jgi:hypothetical protein
MTVYAGDPEEYITFVTTEAYHALSGWMEFRKESVKISPLKVGSCVTGGTPRKLYTTFCNYSKEA